MLSVRIVKYIGYCLLITFPFIGMMMLVGRPDEQVLAPLMMVIGILGGLIAVFFAALDRIIELLKDNAGARDATASQQDRAD